MSSLAILAGIVGIFGCLVRLEYRRHQQRIFAIPHRIHVNGTRGKSSVTRLIGAGLRAGGREGIEERRHRTILGDPAAGQHPGVGRRLPHAAQRDVAVDTELGAHRQGESDVLTVLDIPEAVQVAAASRGGWHRDDPRVVGPGQLPDQVGILLLVGCLLSIASRRYLSFDIGLTTLELHAVGWVVPGLIANWFLKQGIVRTLCTIVITSTLVRFLVILCFSGALLPE